MNRRIDKSKTSPTRGLTWGSFVTVQRQPFQYRGIGIEHQHAHVGDRSQVQHLDQGFRHAFVAMLLSQLLCGDTFD